MPTNQTYYCYMMASQENGTLYIGITSNLKKRVYEHKNQVVAGFTSQYKVHCLVWFEEYADIQEAIKREKQIKKWNRNWKRHLIESFNPAWDDLAQSWFSGTVESRLRGNDRVLSSVTHADY